MVAKRVPGSDWMYMIYDNRDRLVLTQDGNQGLGDVERVDGELVIDRYMGKSYKLNSGAKLKIKPVSGKFTFSSSPGKKFKASFSDFTANQKWIFTKYDELDRPVATGFYYDSDPIDSVRAKVAAITDFEESFTGTGAMQGYDNTAFPSNVSGEDLLSVTYYDDYVFHNEPARPKAKGLPTGAKTRVLGTDKWLTSITYYDDRLRPISMVTDNHLSGQDIVNTTYRNAISGIVLETEMIHSSKYLSQPLKTVETYTYDHMDRLLTVDQEIFEGTTSKGTVRLVTNTYDELGRLQAKDLNSGAQTIDYEYNIRGWLTKLNNGTDLMGTDQFGMQLKYDSAGQYNGNIGQMSWRNLGGSVNSNKAVQTFTYSYDPLNRLNSAIYSNAGKNNHFNVSGITYDGNGNIKTLSRRENNAILDLLIYRYDGKGNQLTGVDDGGDKVNGFKDDTSDIGDEYSYDANGNMILDLNKEISSISYNHLNLPEVVRFESGKYVKYQYDAAGIKLQKIAGLPDTNGNIVETTTDYVGGKHYVNGALEFFQHAEGRVVTSGGTYAYEFNLTDHLGNVRASVDANGNVIQRDDYYPFGSTFQHFNIGDENQYKFNGNEVQVEIPNTADFNARFYDNSLGRFMMVDPLADDPKQLDQSPYQFGWNNPTNLNDPTGLKPGMCCGNWEVRINKRMNPGNYNHEIPPALENSWQFKTIKYGLMGMVAIPTAIYTGEYIAANYVNLLFNPVVHNEVAAGIYGAFMDDEWAVPAVSDNATRGLRRLAGHGVLDVTKLGDDGYRIGGRLVKEGIRSIGDVKITNEGISTIKSHLSRPELDFAAGNEVMIGRLEQIFSGKLKATEQDLYFYSHELTEYNLMNQGYSYDEAHSVAAKAYGVKAKEEVDTFYTQEAQKASDDYFLNNLDK
ncbi:MAG: RHS repeat-associated core domain-containing protein [Bacteroidota bacterium]